MDWPARDRLSPIGVDIGARAVKAVQLRGKASSRQIAAATVIPRPDDAGPALADAEIASLRRVLLRQGFSGNRLVLAVPHDKLRSGIIELPRQDTGAPLDQIARMETASMHRLAPAGFEMAWAVLPPTTRQHELTRAIIAACPHDEADALLDDFAAHALDVVALDVPAAAIVRLVDPAGESDQHVLSIVDLGQTAATITLIHQGMAIYERRLSEAGFAGLADRLIQQFELEDAVGRYLLEEVGLVQSANATGARAATADATASTDEGIAEVDAMPAEMGGVVQEHLENIAGELNTSLSYARHQYPDVEVGAVMLIGGAARIPGLAEALTLQLPCAAAVLEPAQRVAAPPALLETAANPALSLATALALHEGEARA